MPVQVTGLVPHNRSTLGAPEQVVDSLLEYYRLGVRGFLLRGYEIMEDAAMTPAAGQPPSTSSST